MSYELISCFLNAINISFSFLRSGKTSLHDTANLFIVVIYNTHKTDKNMRKTCKDFFFCWKIVFFRGGNISCSRNIQELSLLAMEN